MADFDSFVTAALSIYTRAALEAAQACSAIGAAAAPDSERARTARECADAVLALCISAAEAVNAGRRFGAVD